MGQEREGVGCRGFGLREENPETVSFGVWNDWYRGTSLVGTPPPHRTTIGP